MRLNNDDACAVDLLLEMGARTMQGMEACYTTSADGEIQKRLDRVEALLGELKRFEPSDPPADLVERTLARCENRAAAPANHHPLRPMPSAS